MRNSAVNYHSAKSHTGCRLYMHPAALHGQPRRRPGGSCPREWCRSGG